MVDAMIYERGKKAIFYATFVTTSGEAATISGTPTVSVYHHKTSGMETDVNNQDMTQLVASTYYYVYVIPKNADQGNYLAKFFGTYDTGEDVIGEQIFRIVEKNFFKDAGKGGGGIIKTTGIKDVWTGQEKRGVLEALIKLENSINDLKKVPTPISHPPKEILGKLSEIGVKVEGLADKGKDMGAITEVLSEIKKIKRGDVTSKQLMERLDDIGDTSNTLISLVLKKLSPDELEEFFNSLNENDLRGNKKTGSQGGREEKEEP